MSVKKDMFPSQPTAPISQISFHPDRFINEAANELIDRVESFELPQEQALIEKIGKYAGINPDLTVQDFSMLNDHAEIAISHGESFTSQRLQNWIDILSKATEWDIAKDVISDNNKSARIAFEQELNHVSPGPDELDTLNFIIDLHIALQENQSLSIQSRQVARGITAEYLGWARGRWGKTLDNAMPLGDRKLLLQEARESDSLDTIHQYRRVSAALTIHQKI